MYSPLLSLYMHLYTPTWAITLLRFRWIFFVFRPRASKEGSLMLPEADNQPETHFAARRVRRQPQHQPCRLHLFFCFLFSNLFAHGLHEWGFLEFLEKVVPKALSTESLGNWIFEDFKKLSCFIFMYACI